MYIVWDHMKTSLVTSQVLCVTLRLTSVQSEMKFIEGSDTVALKQHFGKKIMELEDEKRAVQVNLAFELVGVFLGRTDIHLLFFTCFILQQERDRLLGEVENLANSDGQAQKLQDVHSQKLKALEAQVPYFSTRKLFHFG